MTTPHQDQIEIFRPPYPIGKDEMNFAELPLTLVTDKASQVKGDVIERETRVYDPSRKRWIDGTLIIENSKKYGPPTASDAKVHLGLIQLTKEQNDFTSRDVPFTMRELLDVLGWSQEGKNYTRLKQALYRLESVNYIFDKCWYDFRQRRVVSKAFHLLDEVEINDGRSRGRQGSLFPSRFVWNDVVFDSLRAGYLRSIDYERCKKIEHGVALRIYRYLGKHSYGGQQTFEFDLKDFAINKVGLVGKYQGCAHIARALRKALSELEECGFLEPQTDEERYIKAGRNWKICLMLAQPNDQIAVVSPPDGAPEPADQELTPLLSDLTALGVTVKKAAALVKRHPPAYIRSKIDLVTWMRETDPASMTNPGGFLVKAIEDDYAAPKGYKPKAEREESARQAEAARQQRAAEQRRQAEAARQQEAEAAREKAEIQQAEAYWESLESADQDELDRAALDAADEETRQTWQAMAPARLREAYYKAAIRHPYIRQRLLPTAAD